MSTAPSIRVPSAAAAGADGRPAGWRSPPRSGQTAKLPVVARADRGRCSSRSWSCIATSLSSGRTSHGNGGWVLFPDATDPRRPTEEILSGGVGHPGRCWSASVSPSSAPRSACCARSASPTGCPGPGSSAASRCCCSSLFTFLFSPGMIPSYLVVKELGLLDTYGALVLPVLVSVVQPRRGARLLPGHPRGAVRGRPARRRGRLRILLRIVLPLSKAVIAVVGLFYAVDVLERCFNAALHRRPRQAGRCRPVLRTYVLQGDTFNAKAMGITVLPASTSL